GSAHRHEKHWACDSRFWLGVQDQRVAVQWTYEAQRNEIAAYGHDVDEPSVQRVLDDTSERAELHECFHLSADESQCGWLHVRDSERRLDGLGISGRRIGLREIRYRNGGHCEKRGGEVRSVQQQRRGNELYRAVHERIVTDGAGYDVGGRC